jgi:hypothetical protein
MWKSMLGWIRSVMEWDGDAASLSLDCCCNMRNTTDYNSGGTVSDYAQGREWYGGMVRGNGTGTQLVCP